MTMVRFATTCDARPHVGDEPCGARSPEYVVWPHCRECLIDICPEHQHPGSLIEDEGTNTALCHECASVSEDTLP